MPKPDIKSDATGYLPGQTVFANFLPREQQTSGSLVDRLRDRAYSTYRKDPLCEEAAAEIERLLLELSVQKACTVAGREEIERLRTLATHATPGEGSVQGKGTLTDEEREAVEAAISSEYSRGAWHWADTLRSLLERLK